MATSKQNKKQNGLCSESVEKSKVNKSNYTLARLIMDAVAVEALQLHERSNSGRRAKDVAHTVHKRSVAEA